MYKFEKTLSSSAASEQVRIRMAVPEDAPRLLEIYQPYILNTAVTFEWEPVPLEVFRERIETTLRQFPWLVYEKDGVILGYAYCCPFHERAAFSWDCECSVYLAPDCRGLGIGDALYETLFALVQQQGYYNIYALITSSNQSSIRFHEKWGFQSDGSHSCCGYKFGEWHGLTYMSKKIGDLNIPPAPVKNIDEIMLTKAGKLI